MEFRNTSAINPQRPEALVEMSSNALMADDGRVASETHLMNSLSIQIGIRSRGFDDAVGASREGEGGTRDRGFWFCWKSRDRRGAIARSGRFFRAQGNSSRFFRSTKIVPC